MQMLLLQALIAWTLFVTRASGYFVLTASAPVVVQRLDPILSEGKALTSGHAHAFVGSNRVQANTTYHSLRKSVKGWKKGTPFTPSGTCTTTGVWADASSYWSPYLYYRNNNGTFQSVPFVTARLYYLDRVGNKEVAAGHKTSKAFPKGLRMIAGNAMQFDPNNFNSSNHAPRAATSFVCLNYQGGSSSSPNLPTGQCPNGVRMQITFPSCWDGKNLDSPDHQSHMAYPDGLDNGNCPASHPHHLVTLFHEWIYLTHNLPNGGANDKNKHLVLANGDMLGASFHADFINGWNVDVLQEAIIKCDPSADPSNKDLEYLDARIGLCPVFPPYIASPMPSNGTVPTVGNCSASAVVKKDGHALGQNLTYLPGCNPIRNGPFKQTPQTLVGCNASGAYVIANGTSNATASKLPTNPTAHRRSSHDGRPEEHHQRSRRSIF